MRDNNNNKEIKRNKYILVQASVLIMLLFGTFIAINSFATYRNFYDLSIAILKADSDLAKNTARDILQRYSSLSWLLDYWQNNCETLDVSRKSRDMKKYMELPQEILSDRMNVTAEQAESLSPEMQKLFAEFCYMEIMSDLDDLREAEDMHSLYLSKPIIEDNAAFVFYYDDSQVGETSVLGDVFPFKISKHPLVEKMYSTGKDADEFEIVTIKDYVLTHQTEDLFYDYALLNNNNSHYHLVICFLGRELRNSIFNRAMRITVINILCFVLLAVTLLIVINVAILKPLLKVQKDINDYTDNKDSNMVVSRLGEIKSQNEIGRLAGDLSTLAVELDHYTNETGKLSAEKARIDSELSLAAIIQDGVLPKDFPDVKEFKLFAALKPAKEVGGDLYDFFMIDDDHIALIIGDVSGKGISAALFMMKVKTILKETVLSNRELSLKEIVTMTNKLLCDGNEAMMFVTLWFGIMTISTGELTSVNAGHENPIIKGSSGVFELNKMKHYKPLAIRRKAEFAEEKMLLNPGDTFFIYTDGVAEANNSSEELFGEERIIDTLNEHPDSGPEELAELMLRRLDEFAGDAPQFDDITMLCIKYFGNS